MHIFIWYFLSFCLNCNKTLNLQLKEHDLFLFHVQNLFMVSRTFVMYMLEIGKYLVISQEPIRIYFNSLIISLGCVRIMSYVVHMFRKLQVDTVTGKIFSRTCHMIVL